MKEYIIIEKSTGKKFTTEELAVLLYKEGNHIIYCDLEGIAKIDAEYSRSGRDEYYLIDECGNQVWIDFDRFEIKKGN